MTYAFVRNVDEFTEWLSSIDKNLVDHGIVLLFFRLPVFIARNDLVNHFR
jgi:hypothetical protein